MAFLTLTIILSIIGVLAAYFTSRSFRSSRQTLPLPPGPKGLPLLGNINDLPKPGILECHHWLKHKDLYGLISSLTVLGQTFVIINDADIALELLRDRALITSGRPKMVFSGDMIGWRNTIVMQQYDEKFKMHRKNIAKVASSTAILSVFDGVQEEESAHFLLHVLESPADLFDHIRKEAGAVVLRITYGYTPEAHGKDLFVDLASQTVAEFADVTSPGRYAVDVVPFLRYLPGWFPGTQFIATAREMAKRLDRTVELPYAFVKQQMREKKHKTSYVSQAIGDVGLDPKMEHVHKWSAASLYMGGTDTIVSALMTFFLAMTLFPQVQPHARAEIDRTIGSKRLPLSTDKPNLLYIEAVVKETHRWHPVGPMSIPHASSREDTVLGYRVPKGAVLLPNTWGFTHDPYTYPEPEKFDPSRFLGPNPQPDPRIYTFGYGRRKCPGEYVANNALFITIAQVLAVFNISTIEGQEPRVEFEPGVISHPVPFKCRIEPRSEAHAELVRSSEQLWPRRESDAAKLEVSEG